MKKLFGKIDLTWKKIIILAILNGVIIGGLNTIHALLDTSLRDPAIYFGYWIFWGIFIIMNSKSNKDSALKSFLFFLISQPLIYLVEVPFNRLGWGVFVYYKYWLIWTILCLPMGFIGYYMKKNKWWGLLILLPMMGLLADEVHIFMSGMIYSFPHHLLSYIFVVLSLIIYPLAIFDNKKIQITSLIIAIIAILSLSIHPFINKPTYETQIMCSGDKYDFDDTYKASFKDERIGDVSIERVESIDAFCIHTKFYKTGKTQLILESTKGEKQVYNLVVGNNTYNIEEVTKNE